MSIPTKTKLYPIDVVLFYNSDDVDQVEEVYRELQRRGLKPWMDTQDLQPGTRFQQKIGQIIGQARSAAVFYGKNGLGRWESVETEAALCEFIKTNRTMIPVWLRGDGQARAGEGEDDSGDPELMEAAVIFGTFHRVDFKRGVGDPQAYDVLVWGITGEAPQNDRGLFQIQVDVGKADRSCYVIFPHNGPEELLLTIREALKEVGIECSPFDAPSQMPKPSDVVQAILSSELVIAVCSGDPETKEPDPSTMFFLGHATALGKPILCVRDDSETVSPLVAEMPIAAYTDKDLKDDDSLRHLLVQRIEGIVDELRHPYLVEPHRQDVSVAYADMLRIPIAAWDRFEAILSFGLKVYHRFHMLAKHVHKLAKDVDECSRSVNELSEPRAVKRNWRVFERAYKELQDGKLDDGELDDDGLDDGLLRREDFLTADNKPADPHVPAAFEYLEQHTSEPLKEAANQAAKYFDFVLSGICQFFDDHYEEVPPLVKKAKSALKRIDEAGQREAYLKHTTNLSMYLTQMDRDTRVIETQTHAMMAGLLALFGKKRGEMP